eukprot:CAMPEP_0170566660 /NCGR_PEP_ID=MMETSP0211-20121228/79986_1 /TAXON_ID=311385 /ORGANISM="Pseudokeronopsis sp., Strain OXSARD2" /LENGTH=67 /DNA_ID=CAMNT_0010887903 /DNA_START=99 /DNA_END=302 /DNA_ORIENTATION=+
MKALSDVLIEQRVVVDEGALPHQNAKKISISSFLHNRTDSIQEIEPQEDRMAEALTSLMEEEDICEL